MIIYSILIILSFFEIIPKETADGMAGLVIAGIVLDFPLAFIGLKHFNRRAERKEAKNKKTICFVPADYTGAVMSDSLNTDIMRIVNKTEKETNKNPYAVDTLRWFAWNERHNNNDDQSVKEAN